MAHIEEDGQSCIQEMYDKFGPDITSSIEKCIYRNKRLDGRTKLGKQVLDKDIPHWRLVDDDRYIEEYDIIRPLDCEYL